MRVVLSSGVEASIDRRAVANGALAPSRHTVTRWTPGGRRPAGSRAKASAYPTKGVIPIPAATRMTGRFVDSGGVKTPVGGSRATKSPARRLWMCADICPALCPSAPGPINLTPIEYPLGSPPIREYGLATGRAADRSTTCWPGRNPATGPPSTGISDRTLTSWVSHRDAHDLERALPVPHAAGARFVASDLAGDGPQGHRTADGIAYIIGKRVVDVRCQVTVRGESVSTEWGTVLPPTELRHHHAVSEARVQPGAQPGAPAPRPHFDPVALRDTPARRRGGTEIERGVGRPAAQRGEVAIGAVHVPARLGRRQAQREFGVVRWSGVGGSTVVR